MSKLTLKEGSSDQVQWLPAIDWNVKFFGAHEQMVKNNWSAPKESHIGFEIILILDGCQETLIEGNPYILQAGDMILIPPGFKHLNRCISKNGMHYFCAHFNVDDPDFRQGMAKLDRLLFPAGTEANNKIKQILDHWISMVRNQGGYTTADRFHIQVHLFELFGILAQMVSKEVKKHSAVAPATIHYAQLIAEAIKARFNPHLPQNIELTIQIEDIISSLGISPGYGLQVFRKVFGVSPRQYLSELKLHEAKVLIQQPDLALKEIASRLGYAHLSHFSRQFKRWTGISPLQYRQKSTW
ncbi:AraC family transcriptional regulator [Paenibacillus sp. SYP-B3998]|uniref:AraC family transcriptional regulator n=1 Tax=Paenibacillus sp. SYP-B3998 TaxID=2678564 RepID=A0A6G4A5G3_9BACL|nr:AraC family transcriptional regulator [Paenibacillus sp. SYP-B3998]NEW09184.1 AraC family transcriptional regulator [Paenibacillus sp. SYP-B3998]